MEIKNTKVYGLEESIIRSGYPHSIGEPDLMTELHKIDLCTIPEEVLSLNQYGIMDYAKQHNLGIPIKMMRDLTEQDMKRIKTLAQNPVGSGHNNFLKGIIVQFDLRYPQYFTPQLQRYHWIDIVSSQSKMHSLTKIKDIKDSCNKYVIDYSIDIINFMIQEYNSDKEYPRVIDYTKELYQGDFTLVNERVESKQELFQYIISNLPMGFEMWMGISTNYLQLKTIYQQRKGHKLKDDWGYFLEWIESLPMAQELIIKNKKDE